MPADVIDPLYFGTGAAASSSGCRRLCLMSAVVDGSGCRWRRVALSPVEHTRPFRVQCNFTIDFNLNFQNLLGIELGQSQNSV